MRKFRRSLPMSLLRAREAVMKNFLPHLREHGLSAQQWRVLRALFDLYESAQDDMEMTTLADQCYLLMPSMSRIIQNLEKRELVLRRTSASDLRRSKISLTEAGIKLVRIMSPQSEQRYQHITNVFGYGKLELLYELLDELTEKLDTTSMSEQDAETKNTKTG